MADLIIKKDRKKTDDSVWVLKNSSHDLSKFSINFNFL
jgi:hypothetical protein